MKKIISFNCETITPMFMYGGDSKTLELRPSEFKGMLRFWWRALHPDLSLKDLKERESEIFGSTDKKSSFRIKGIYDKIKQKEYKVLPHQPDEIIIFDKKLNKNIKKKNRKAFKLKAFYPNEKFKVIFIFFKDCGHLIKLIKNLFILSTVIGGFGMRSRRGFGSIQINKINNENFNYEEYLSLDEIKKLIETINPNFNYHFMKQDENYPFIKSIEIGTNQYNSYDNLLKHIGQITHDCKCGKSGVFSSLDRFASPCYVSVIKEDSGYYPIITSLNIALPENQRLSQTQVQTIAKFKNSILKKKNLCKTRRQ